MPKASANLEQLLHDLPDREEAERFFGRLTTEHRQLESLFARDPGLLSDSLALAAWSPFLATTLLQHPEHFQWLARERRTGRVRGTEELGESLARFASTNSTLPLPTLLARFRRRELLRIYLRDIRQTATLVETTEELSNLADAILAFALAHARRELDNLYGTPLRTDERGRAAAADFVIVALGKLGSRELNFASDIDLLFLYSDDGSTTGAGERGATTNREYFVRLATRVSTIVGGTAQTGGGGAAYRVDLRLRPHGRDGALAPSLLEAVRYYTERAQRWELQALIRSRAAAGDAGLFERFAAGVRNTVYRRGETLSDALAHVRRGKQKIDLQHGGEAKGVNVKLGRGGVREIEFIAQALQLAYGGADEWLRASHTLVSLGRISDRRLVNAAEHTALVDAYVFLRKLEHRLQMEHGLQTHLVPQDAARRRTLARRMNFGVNETTDFLADFDRILESHRAGVRQVYDRIFDLGDEEEAATRPESSTPLDDAFAHARDEANAAAHEHAASSGDNIVSARLFGEETAAHASLALNFIPHLAASDKPEINRSERTSRAIETALAATLNERRARLYLARIAASLVKAEPPVRFTAYQLGELVRLCGTSDFFGEMIANRPRLIAALPTDDAPETHESFRRMCGARFDSLHADHLSTADTLAEMRNAHADLLVRIGALDVRGDIGLREANRRQTVLATASIDAAYRFAERELARRHNGGHPLDYAPRLAVLGLGRLGGGGMDYGSDLDLVLVFDGDHPSPLSDHTHETAYTLFAELLVTALSSFTRDGYLYRVDLRLRPDGRNGAIVTSRAAFVNYLSERAAAWELLAYVQLCPSAGDRDLGARVLEEASHAMRERVAQFGVESLRDETRRVRERLEREHATRREARGRLDIKFDPGGMLDVYFAVRFLNLRENSDWAAEDRSTAATLERLHEAGVLDDANHGALTEGYALLRRLDHSMRLVLGRGTRLPPADSPALADLAACVNYDSPAAMLDDVREGMKRVRKSFMRVTGDGG